MAGGTEPALAILSVRDYLGLLPEIVLCLTALALLLEEMLLPRGIALISGTAFLGCALAFAALWAAPATGGLGQLQPDADRLVMFGVFAVDGLSMLFRGVVILATGIVILMSSQYATRFRNPGEFMALLLFAALAAALVCGSCDLVMAYLAIEFLSITS